MISLTVKKTQQIYLVHWTHFCSFCDENLLISKLIHNSFFYCMFLLLNITETLWLVTTELLIEELLSIMMELFRIVSTKTIPIKIIFERIGPQIFSISPIAKVAHIGTWNVNFEPHFNMVKTKLILFFSPQSVLLLVRYRKIT